MADIALRVVGAAAGAIIGAGTGNPALIWQFASYGYLAGAPIGGCARRDDLSPQFAENGPRTETVS